MNTVTCNVSFPAKLMGEVDVWAKRESRTRSDLLREAARLYIQRQEQWETLFGWGDAMVRETGLTSDDVTLEIRAVRRSKAKKRVDANRL